MDQMSSRGSSVPPFLMRLATSIPTCPECFHLTPLYIDCRLPFQEHRTTAGQHAINILELYRSDSCIYLVRNIINDRCQLAQLRYRKYWSHNLSLLLMVVSYTAVDKFSSVRFSCVNKLYLPIVATRPGPNIALLVL